MYADGMSSLVGLMVNDICYSSEHSAAEFQLPSQMSSIPTSRSASPGKDRRFDM